MGDIDPYAWILGIDYPRCLDGVGLQTEAYRVDIRLANEPWTLSDFVFPQDIHIAAEKQRWSAQQGGPGKKTRSPTAPTARSCNAGP